MKILITGGAGYIGSILTEACIAAGHETVVYDNLIMGHREALRPETRLIVGDVADQELLAATLSEGDTDAVVHMAGFGYVGESMNDPGKYFRNNSCRPVALLEAMVSAGVKKIVFSSSCSIYGVPGETMITEAHPCDPTNAYGTSKLIFERILDWYDTIHGIKHASLRYFNVAGASGQLGEDHDPESHLIPLVIKAAMGQLDHIEIYGDDYETPDGTCVRDYIHIEDLARAHLLALDGLDSESVHYNLGNEKGYSVLEVIDTVRSVSGRSIATRVSARRPGDPPSLIASSQKIEAELGWRRRFPELEKIVASAWDWHVRNPHGYAGAAG